MQSDNVSRAAQTVHACWTGDTTMENLVADERPNAPEDGYAIQAELVNLFAQRRLGWKIAATAAAGRQHINVDRPLAGQLLESMVHDDGASVAFGQNRMAVAEAEIVLTLGRGLPAGGGPWTEDQVAAAVDRVSAGLEFPDSRFTDFTAVGTSCLIADNACARQFVLGGPRPVDFDLHDLEDIETLLLINGEEVSSGFGRDALGGPLRALTWLANTLGDLGVDLKPDDFVTTGVTGIPSPVSPGDSVMVEIGRLGRVHATLDG